MHQVPYIGLGLIQVTNTHPLLLQLPHRVEDASVAVVVRPPPPLPGVQQHVGQGAHDLERLNRRKVVKQPLLVQVCTDDVGVAVRVRVGSTVPPATLVVPVGPVQVDRVVARAPAGGHGRRRRG